MQFHEQLPGSVWVPMNFWGWAWIFVVWVGAYRSFDPIVALQLGHSKGLILWNAVGVPTVWAVVLGMLPLLLLRSGVRLWRRKRE